MQKKAIKKEFIQKVSYTTLLCVAIIILSMPLIGQPQGDTESYIEMASGKQGEVSAPFNTRIIHPFLVGIVVTLTGSNIHEVFLWIGISSLWLILYISLTILEGAGAFQKYAILIFLSPAFALLTIHFYHPDLFFSMLVALFLALIAKGKDELGIYLLPVIILTREIGVILAVAYVIGAYVNKKKHHAFDAAGAGIVGVFFMILVGNGSPSNPHGLGSFLYLPAKAVFNTLRNVFGYDVWANTIPYCDPAWKVLLPEWLQTQKLTHVGLCGWNYTRIVGTLQPLLTLFGTAPLLLWYGVRKKFSFKKLPLWVKTAGLYGMALFILAPIMGTAVSRIVAYAWPLFLLVLPAIAKKKMFTPPVIALLFVTAWIPVVFEYGTRAYHPTLVIGVGLAMLTYLATYELLQRSKL
jgi:hypothetical protein